MSSAIAIDISCAAEVFLIAAMLHRENPERSDFSMQEMVKRAAEENLTGVGLRSGISVHLSQHCVANKPPNPAKHRTLYATSKHNRRLLLPGDMITPGRTGKVFPDANEIPGEYRELLEWAQERYRSHLPQAAESGTAASGLKQWLEDVLKLRLAGEHLADGVDPDEHVRQLREGWD